MVEALFVCVDDEPVRDYLPPVTVVGAGFVTGLLLAVSPADARDDSPKNSWDADLVPQLLLHLEAVEPR